METYLAHRGILGMKVGIRRYQNEDGTLTSAGKRHITSLEGKKESQKSRYDAASKKSRVKKLRKVYGQSTGENCEVRPKDLRNRSE